MATTANYPLKQIHKSLLNDEHGFHSPTTSSFTYSGFKAFDIEVDMARALITADPNARPRHFRNVFEEVVFVFTVMMATACTTFIQGVVNINTATIGRDLIMTPAEITWIAAAIGLASGSFMLFFGKTADLFGRKIQIVAGLAFLALCSLITAFAPTPTAFNILCGFLGLGTAVIAPPAIGLLFTTYPEGRRRNRVTGALGAGNPIGFLLGSISSGTATKYASWRASFFVLAAFFLVMTVMAIWTMPAIPRSGNASAMVKQFDYLDVRWPRVELFRPGVGVEVEWESGDGDWGSGLYISKAMPTQSSLGAGVLQTAMRLSISIGLSITSAAYGSAASTTAGKQNRTLPYERAYLCSIIFAVLGLSFVPFMKIGRQGKKSPPPSLHENTSEVSRIVSGLSRLNSWSGFGNGSSIVGLESKSSLRYKPTSVSVNVNRMSVATIRSEVSVGSAESWEPRWSAEADEDRFIAKDEMMVYEVCTKCMEEQRSFVPIVRESVDAWDTLPSVGEGGDTRPLSNHRHTWSGEGRFAHAGLGPMSPLVVRDVRMVGFGVREGEWI
ncbi:hypothetical protein EG329_014241 [Mollisiaceae sp. DMI_Dod_QoI]|nr:hypothetical protein EG329_014241 [Helotiales sp. DMI_Dod_QoI]